MAKAHEFKIPKKEVNPRVKIFPTRREIEAGVYLSNPNDKDSTPALNGDGKPVPVERTLQGGARPLTIDRNSISNSPHDRSPFDKVALERGMVELKHPNDDPNSNLRNRTSLIALRCLEDNGDDTFTLNFDSDYFKDGHMVVDIPVNPYMTDDKGNVKRLEPEMRNYLDHSSGKVTKRLMVPVGFSNGEPVYDDGMMPVVKEGSKHAAMLKERGVDMKTYDTLVKYEYKREWVPVSDVIKVFEKHYTPAYGSQQTRDNLAVKYRSDISVADDMTNRAASAGKGSNGMNF